MDSEQSKENNLIEISAQAYAKMVMHAMKYAQCSCGGFLLGPKEDRIEDAIPVSHASLGLSPNVEIAYNSVNSYASQQNLVICGYYHADKDREANGPDPFSQKITEKLCENSPKAVLCFLKFEPRADPLLVPYQFLDGKWRKKPEESIAIDTNPVEIIDKAVYSSKKLYREIIDFDDHLNDISLDWLNSKLSQKIDDMILTN